MKPDDEPWGELGREVTRDGEVTLSLGNDEVPMTAAAPGTDSFEIVDRLGAGGMGVVELARQESLGRLVALKRLKPGRSSKPIGERALFTEAKVLALLDHPNIVPVHGLTTDDEGRLSVVMKRIDGRPWNEVLEARSSLADDLETHVRILVDVCNAIAFAHERGVLHRDLKPSNVMVGRFGEVWVLDWGLAMRLDGGPEFLPSTHSVSKVVGTPAYIAPEMLDTSTSGQTLGPHTDVYLLGGVLHQILTGHPPHRGTLEEQLRSSYESARPTFGSTSPGELAAVCARSLSRDPELRFTAAREMGDALHDALGHLQSEHLGTAALSKLENLLARLHPADEADRNRTEIYRLFGEVRFGLTTALEAWPGNTSARQGLNETLAAMSDYELERGAVETAQAIYAEAPDPSPERIARLDSARRANLERRRHHAAVAHDYDARVGASGRRGIAVALGLAFATGPLISRAVESATLPAPLAQLHADPVVAVANLAAFSFVPIILGFAWWRRREIREHKTSRVFVVGSICAYLLGLGARTSTLWAGQELRFALAAESAVFASAVCMLGLAMDTRFVAAGAAWAAGALCLSVLDLPPIDLYSAGATLSCLAYLVADRHHAANLPPPEEPPVEGNASG